MLSSLALATAAAALPLALPAMTVAPNRPKLLIFDVNETLLDLSKLQQAVNQEFKSETAFKQWFALLLQYSLVDTVTGNYHNFGQIGDAALDMLAQALGQPARPVARKKELLTIITELPPHPDIIPGLTALQKAGFRMVTLTNSPDATVTEADGLRRPHRLFRAAAEHRFAQALQAPPQHLLQHLQAAEGGPRPGHAGSRPRLGYGRGAAGGPAGCLHCPPGSANLPAGTRAHPHRLHPARHCPAAHWVSHRTAVVQQSRRTIPDTNDVSGRTNGFFQRQIS
ncbi:HAD family hydrolase [Hymenobacter roseosalivarius]